MVVPVHHFVGDRIFQVPLVDHLVGANLDTVNRVKTTRLAVDTSSAANVMRIKIAS